MTSSSASSYDEAVEALYQASHAGFAAERQRLAAEIKQSGDKATAARVAKLARPTLSAWVVNQLWWHSREPFEALFETAAALRSGKLEQGGAHRKAIAKLVALAEKRLTESGHAATDATLRRVSMTLSGLAAVGGFDPEPAGALTKDRDPPGFEAFAATDLGEAPAASPRSAPRGKTHERDAAREHEHAEAKRARELEATTKKRIAEAHAKAAERRVLEATLRAAKSELAARELTHQKAARALAAAAHDVEQARAAVEAAEVQLAAPSSRS